MAAEIIEFPIKHVRHSLNSKTNPYPYPVVRLVPGLRQAVTESYRAALYLKHYVNELPDPPEHIIEQCEYLESKINDMVDMFWLHCVEERKRP